MADEVSPGCSRRIAGKGEPLSHGQAASGPVAESAVSPTSDDAVPTPCARGFSGGASSITGECLCVVATKTKERKRRARDGHEGPARIKRKDKRLELDHLGRTRRLAATVFWNPNGDGWTGLLKTEVT
jgi:hypothetical protein